MRKLILILILLVVAAIIAVQSNLLDIRQTRDAEAPKLSADGNGVTAAGGQPPAFEVETGKVAIGSQDKNVTVKVPALEVRPASEGNDAGPAGNAN